MIRVSLTMQELLYNQDPNTCFSAFLDKFFTCINTFGIGPHIYCICEEKLFTGYQATYIYVLNENPGVMALGANTMCYFCGSSVFWKLRLSSKCLDPWLAFKTILSRNYGSQTINRI